MSKLSLEPLTLIEGFLAAALVNYSTGHILQSAGDDHDLAEIATGNTNVIRAKLTLMQKLNLEDRLEDRLEDILISLEKQYHLLRLVQDNDKLFLFLVLERSQSNLAMARYALREFEQQLAFS